MRRANPERAPDGPRTVAAGRGAMSRRGCNVAFGAVTVLVLLAVAPGAWALCDDDTDEVFWNEFEVCKTYDGTEDFVEQCGNSDRVVEARECLERWDAEAAEWERVGCTDIAQVERFIETHPNGRLIESARECLAKLNEQRERELEVAEWERVGCTDIEKVERFIETHAEGQLIKRARECLAKLKERHLLVEKLLKECRAHRESHRLTTGIGGNALECYEKVLEKDSGNQEALEGIDSIVQGYIDKAHAGLADQAPDAVERAIHGLERANPEHPEVETLEARLEALRDELAKRDLFAIEREELRAEVETLLEQKEYEQALSQLEEGRNRGFDDKGLRGLETRAREGLEEEAARRDREVEAKVAEARARLGQDDFAGARARLGEARELGLDDEAHTVLAREIDKEEVALMLTQCNEHKKEHNWNGLRECANRVMALEPGNAEAEEYAKTAESFIVWRKAKDAGSVEGWYEFMQANPGHAFFNQAKREMEKLEEAYWGQVKIEDTPEAYERYEKYFPEGRYVDEARRKM